MNVLTWIIAFSLVGGLLSAVAAAAFLLAPAGWRVRIVPHLISFATGALLGAALIGLLPHALQTEGVSFHAIGTVVLVGILVFFVLEKFALWRHCHADECEVHSPHDHHRDAATANMILLGDGLHNLLDGMLIAGAFLIDTHLGIVTAVAVFAHELPQEIGDLAILLQGGMSRSRALTYNLLVSLLTPLGAVLAYLWFSTSTALLPYVIAVAASSFLYVAVADLIPGLHRRLGAAAGAMQLVMIGAGVLFVQVTHSTLH